MSYRPDDPKWTAYVLGELSPSDLEVVERELAESAEARQAVAEIRAVTDQLTLGLRSSAGPGLTDRQREALRDGAARETLPLTMGRPRRSRGRLLVACGAIAASLLVAALVLPALQSAKESGRRNEVAQVDEQRAAQEPGVTQELDNAETREDHDGRQSEPRALQDRLRIRFRTMNETVTAEADIADAYSKKQAKEAETSWQLRAPRLQEARTPAAQPAPPAARHFYSTVPEPTNSPAKPPAGPEAAAPAASPHPAGPADRAKRPTLLGAYGGDKTKKDVNGSTAAPASSQAATPVAPAQSSYRFGYEREYWASETRAPQAESQVDVRYGRTAGPQNPFGYRDLSLAQRPTDYVSAEAYDHIEENAFLSPRDNPLSTFSIDVDTASYSNLRRYLLTNAQWPPKGAVRIEEMINYFNYEYPQPDGDVSFSTTVEVAGCPWNGNHRLVRVGLKGKEIDKQHRPLSNLVFLLDVSGSMAQPNKLPLVKQSMRLLAEQLQENDRVAIVVYAGSSGLVLPSTSAMDRKKITDALDQLEAGGSTNGGQGIQLAYQIALENFIKGGTNRVILATDGDFNVGVTDRTTLIEIVKENAAKGVFLTSIGFGMGNLKDGTLEQLADKGNGNYAYIDDLKEAKKLFVEQLSGTLVPIAKDVKIQIEFNPAAVESYRLIGYENRALRAEDFNDDKKDAGEIGAGHTVTALYELVLAGKSDVKPAVDPLKYQRPAAQAAGPTDELLTLKLRYKQPDGDVSKLLEHAVRDGGQAWAKASTDYKFAASVALFGMILRESQHKGTATLDSVLELAREGMGSDHGGYRSEFIQLVEKAKKISGK